MGTYHAKINWTRRGENFTDQKYSRRHEWHFDGGASVPGSSSPLSVPLPYSDPTAVDPEEAFIASISSCHMLWFLSLAAKRGLVVDEYSDEAIGVMEKNAEGKMAMTRVTLRPAVSFNGGSPGAGTLAELHHEAHELCYIANSVRTRIEVRVQSGKREAASED